MASLVPEPMEKWAVCAASPSSTMFCRRQVAQRTVVKFTHWELLPTILCPRSTSAHSSAMRSMDASSLCPGGSGPGVRAANPARRHTSSCSSRMKVLASPL